MKKCKMVSLDTSSIATGFAYWEAGKLKESGTMLNKKTSDLEEKITNMCEMLINYLKKKKPQIVVIEMTVVENNAHTQRILSEIVGCVRGYCSLAAEEPDFIRLRPTQWRKLTKDEYVTQKMKSKEYKKWSIEKVKRDYDIIVKDDNEADAILIGQAHINSFLISQHIA